MLKKKRRYQIQCTGRLPGITFITWCSRSKYWKAK